MAIFDLGCFVCGVTIFNGKSDTSIDNFGYTSATYFIFIYFVAAYIRLYGSDNFLSSKKATLIGSITSLSIVVILCFGAVNPYIYHGMLALCDLNSPLVIISALFIFSFFKNIHWTNRLINYLAGSMFGVYLIHEDSFIRPFIWQSLISSKLLATSPLNYLLLGIGFSFLVFASCIIIDIIFRRIIFQKIINKLTYLLTKALKFAIHRC